MTISVLTDKIWSPTRRPATWAALPFLIAFANIPTAFPPVTWIPRLFPIRWNDTRCGSLKHKIKLNIIYYVLQCNEVDGKAKKTGFKTVTKHHFFHANLNKISIWESGSNLWFKNLDSQKTNISDSQTEKINSQIINCSMLIQTLYEFDNKNEEDL